GGAVTHDALLVAHRLAERLPEADAHVLDREVEVDVQVALGVHREIHQRVLGPRLQHVVEERDAGVDLGGPRPVQVQVQDDLGLLGVPLDPALSRLRRLRAPLPGHRAPSRAAAMRTAAAAPCPSRPSTRDSSATCGPASASPAGEYSITLSRVTKSSVESAEEKRAVPPVGSTWFGPAT